MTEEPMEDTTNITELNHAGGTEVPVHEGPDNSQSEKHLVEKELEQVRIIQKRFLQIEQRYGKTTDFREDSQEMHALAQRAQKVTTQFILNSILTQDGNQAKETIEQRPIKNPIKLQPKNTVPTVSPLPKAA